MHSGSRLLSALRNGDTRVGQGAALRLEVRQGLRRGVSRDEQASVGNATKDAKLRMGSSRKGGAASKRALEAISPLYHPALLTPLPGTWEGD